MPATSTGRYELLADFLWKLDYRIFCAVREVEVTSKVSRSRYLYFIKLYEKFDSHWCNLA